jgi:tetratricopeptide (TPR) repeat protein
VKVMQRRAMAAVAVAVGAMAGSGALQAQTRTGPTPDTPRLLVAVFSANDRVSGVSVSDAVRTRVTNSVNPRFLYVIPKNDIVNYLESSGYKADSSLGPSDLKELAKLLRADEIVFGHVTRTAAGYQIEPRLLLARDPTIAQPLPPVTGASVNDMMRDIDRALTEARKQLTDNRACENALRDQQYQRAIASANAAMAKYPNAVMARTCLASAYQAMKLPPDSILRVADEIRKLDPKNSWGARFAYLAYEAKNDQENAVRALVTLMSLEPWNTTLQGQVVSALAKLGKPTVAIPIVDTLLMSNPGDPQLLRQKWLLTLAAAAAAGTDTAAARSLYEQALTAGETMIRADTMMADSMYYSRQVSAAALVAPARGVEFASRAVQKFPNNAELWFIKGQLERRAGQLQMAQQSVARTVSLDPKFPNARLMQAQLFTEMGMTDSTVAMTRAAVAAGEDAKTWGAMLLAPTQEAFKKAQESKALTDYEKALTLAEESDKLSSSPTAAFFIGASAFSIGIQLLQDAQRPKSCPMSRRAQEMLLKTQVAMPRGGSIDRATAGQILGYTAQYLPAAEQMVKSFCK